MLSCTRLLLAHDNFQAPIYYIAKLQPIFLEKPPGLKVTSAPALPFQVTSIHPKHPVSHAAAPSQLPYNLGLVFSYSIVVNFNNDVIDTLLLRAHLFHFCGLQEPFQGMHKEQETALKCTNQSTGVK